MARYIVGQSLWGPEWELVAVNKMSQPFSLVLDTRAKSGKLDEVKSAVQGLVQDVQQNEPGTLFYRCFADEATGKVSFVDTYASSEAFLTHLSRPTVEKAIGAIMERADVEHCTVFGTVDANAKAALDKFQAEYLPEVAGFSRAKVPVRIEADQSPRP